MSLPPPRVTPHLVHALTLLVILAGTLTFTLLAAHRPLLWLLGHLLLLLLWLGVITLPYLLSTRALAHTGLTAVCWFIWLTQSVLFYVSRRASQHDYHEGLVADAATTTTTLVYWLVGLLMASLALAASALPAARVRPLFVLYALSALVVHRDVLGNTLWAPVLRVSVFLVAAAAIKASEDLVITFMQIYYALVAPPLIVLAALALQLVRVRMRVSVVQPSIRQEDVVQRELTEDVKQSPSEAVVQREPSVRQEDTKRRESTRRESEASRREPARHETEASRHEITPQREAMPRRETTPPPPPPPRHTESRRGASSEVLQWCLGAEVTAVTTPQRPPIPGLW